MGLIRSGRTKNRREPGGPSSAMANEHNNDISNKSNIKKNGQTSRQANKARCKITAQVKILDFKNLCLRLAAPPPPMLIVPLYPIHYFY